MPSKYASIDIKAMTGLVSAADSSAGELSYDQWGFQSILSPVDVDSSPAAKIGQVGTWLQGAVPGLTRRLALAQAIEAQGHAFAAVVTIDESQLSTLAPSDAQIRGQQDAKKLRDTQGKVDPKLIAEIAKYRNDPYFAHGFASSLTPQELSQIVQNASYQKPGSNGSYYGQDYAGDTKAWSEAYGQLLSAVGGTTATATRSTGGLALPSDYGTTWADTITQDIPSSGGRARYGQGGALSLLLRYGNYGTTFLNDVSTRVYAYETDPKTGHSGMWHDRAYVDGNFQGAYDPDGHPISDPLAGIMSALGHNPDAAQKFFSEGGTTTVSINGKDVPVNARMKYLIQDRTWAGDKGSDNGDGLGSALQSATTWYRDNMPPGWQSASIAAQTFALIGSKTGDGQSDGGLFGIGSHQGWKMWDGMRGHVANIVASYAPDLIRTAGIPNPKSMPWPGSWVNDDPNNSLFPPNGPHSAWMDPELMKKIIGTLGEDQKNLDIVNAGIGAAGRFMLDYQLRKALADPNAPLAVIRNSQSVPGIDGPTSALALALNFSITAGYHGDKSKEAFDKARAENISKILGVVTSVPILQVPEGHAWTEFLIDTVKDQALDKIGEGPDATATDTYNDTSADFQTKLQEMTLDSLLGNGYFADSHYAQANSGVPNAPYKSPFDPAYAGQNPPAVSKGADGRYHFNFGSQAYRDWVQSGSPAGTWASERVVGPFRDNLPAYGG